MKFHCKDNYCTVSQVLQCKLPIFKWLNSVNEEEIIQGISLRKLTYALPQVIYRKITRKVEVKI